MNNPPTLLILAGPTASGKSDLAYRLGEALLGTVINADALQLYRELPLLTAQPDLTQTQLSRVPHRLYGAVSGQERFSVAAWLDLAQDEIHKSWEHAALPIVVGGSGMYLQRLTRGLAPMPENLGIWIAEAEQMIVEQGSQALYDLLADADRARLHPNDKARLIRAYAVYRASGKSWLECRQHNHEPEFLRDTHIVRMLLLPERQALYRNCDRRLERLFAAPDDDGIFCEVKNIMDYDDNLPVMRAIGVASIKDYLTGRITRAQSLAQAQKLTRNYAKRQYTWLRHQFSTDITLTTCGGDISEPELQTLGKRLKVMFADNKCLPNRGKASYDNRKITYEMSE